MQRALHCGESHCAHKNGNLYIFIFTNPVGKMKKCELLVSTRISTFSLRYKLLLIQKPLQMHLSDSTTFVELFFLTTEQVATPQKDKRNTFVPYLQSHLHSPAENAFSAGESEGGWPASRVTPLAHANFSMQSYWSQ